MANPSHKHLKMICWRLTSSICWYVFTRDILTSSLGLNYRYTTYIYFYRYTTGMVCPLHPTENRTSQQVPAPHSMPGMQLLRTARRRTSPPGMATWSWAGLNGYSHGDNLHKLGYKPYNYCYLILYNYIMLYIYIYILYPLITGTAPDFVDPQIAKDPWTSTLVPYGMKKQLAHIMLAINPTISHDIPHYMYIILYSL